MAAGATTIEALRREIASLREENEGLRRALEGQSERGRALAAWEEEVASLRAENARLKKILKALEEHLALLRAKRFGPRSEKGHPGQLTLFDLEAAEGSEEDRAEETITYTRKKPRRAPARQGFPEHLARNEYAVDPPEDERVCECCESDLVRIRSEVTERGDVIPPRVVINRYVRGVWGCRNGCVPPKMAELPPSVVPKTKWEPSAYAYVAVAKYGDHLPLHRQSSIFRRHGIEMPKSTLCDMALAAAEAIRPVVREMAREVRKSEVLLADETPIRVAVEEEGKRATFSAVVAIVGFVDVPIVFLSARLFRSIHPTVIRSDSVGLEDPMIYTLLASLAAVLLLWWGLFRLRCSLLFSEAAVKDIETRLER